jgi:gag-polypeptide of LTR copia-type/Domain of unknown function (DUF4219)
MSQKYQIEPLDVDNYAIWSKKMKSVLIEKDLWDGAFVGKKLSDTSATTIDDKASHKALALITLNVADHHVTEIGDCTTAKEAWDLLEGVYKAKSGAKRLLLRKQLNDLKKEPEESLSVYFSRAKLLQKELTAAGLTVDPTDVVLQVLNGLPALYATKVSIIEEMKTLPTLDEILSTMLPVELKETSQQAEDIALFSRADRSRNGRVGGSTRYNLGFRV